MIEFTYRPIDQWPPDTPIKGRRAPFSAHYGTTLDLLDRELRHLGARNVVLQVAINEADIRLDGRPRARAVAAHPGIILAFDSKYGPLKYATGEFSTWQDNIRAVALGLEALRKVDRYGITKRGEQYTGWKALPAAGETGGAPAGFSSADDAARWLADLSGQYEAEDLLQFRDWARDAYRMAAKRLHPDAGGSVEEFQRLQHAWELLEGGVSA